MDLFKSNTPSYKTGSAGKPAFAQRTASSNGLSGLIGSLFGTTPPAYKTAGAQAPSLCSSSGLRSMFAVVPSYKDAQVADLADQALDDDLVAVELAQAEASALDDDGAICVRAPDEVVLL